MRFPKYARWVVAVALAASVAILEGGSAAATSKSSPSPGLTLRSEAISGEGSHFYSAATVDIAGDIVGDVYASGQSITVSGNVSGDVIAAAQTITVTGSVDGDVRLAAQEVTISGDISRSGTVFAATVTVTDTGSFGRDVVSAAANMSIAGEIDRDLSVSVGSLSIVGTVGGDVTYQSDSDARITDGAVGGTIDRVAMPRSSDDNVSPGQFGLGWILALIYALVALSLINIVAALLLPQQLVRVTNELVPSPWKALLVGFLASIAVPIALLAALISIVGAPLALAGFIVWLVLTLSSFVYVAFYLGRLLFRGVAHPVVGALVGGAIIITALHIPWLNLAVWAATVWLGLGAQLLQINRARPWRGRSNTVEVAERKAEPSAVESSDSSRDS